MEKFLQAVLELDQPVVIAAVMLIAFVPSSVVIFIKKLNHWVKTITVLLFGELGALLLGILAVAAKAAGVGGLLPECTIIACILAILILVFAVFGHIRKWEIADWWGENPNSGKERA